MCAVQAINREGSGKFRNSEFLDFLISGSPSYPPPCVPLGIKIEESRKFCIQHLDFWSPHVENVGNLEILRDNVARVQTINAESGGFFSWKFCFFFVLARHARQLISRLLLAGFSNLRSPKCKVDRCSWGFVCGRWGCVRGPWSQKGRTLR